MQLMKSCYFLSGFSSVHSLSTQYSPTSQSSSSMQFSVHFLSMHLWFSGQSLLVLQVSAAVELSGFLLLLQLKVNPVSIIRSKKMILIFFSFFQRVPSLKEKGIRKFAKRFLRSLLQVKCYDFLVSSKRNIVQSS